MIEIIADGVNAFIFKVKNEGMEITLSGWNSRIRNFDVGEILLISTDGGHSGSSYRIIEKNNPLQPKDQYFLQCEFLTKAEVEEIEK